MIRLIPKGSFIFDNPWQPPPPAERQKTGSGRIEVEMDGNTYIYEQERTYSEGQEK